MLFGWIHWARGIVEFEACDGFVERFLNLASLRGLRLWEVRATPNGVRACTTCRDYSRLAAVAQKTCVSLQVRRQRGLPFVWKRYRRRFGFFAGIFLFAAALWLPSQFVWSIETVGGADIPRTEVLAALQRIGLQRGSFIPAIDENASEQKLMLALPELSWAAIYCRGTVLVAELRERTAPPEMIPEDQPCNVVAAKSGHLLQLTVLEGQAVKKVGEGVRAGALLVSGVVEGARGGSYLRRAEAVALAEVDYHFAETVPLRQTVREKTGEQETRYYLRLLNLRLPLWFYGEDAPEYLCVTEKKEFSFLGYILPFWIEREERQTVQSQIITLTPEAAQLQARRQMGRRVCRELESLQAAALAVSFSADGESCTMFVDCTVVEDIALQQPIAAQILPESLNSAQP